MKMTDEKLPPGNWPDELHLRDTGLDDGYKHIWTTAGMGYPTVKYVRADVAARLAADQQKGGGEVYGYEHDGNYWPAADATPWIFHHARPLYTAPQPSIPAPAQQDGKASGGGFVEYQCQVTDKETGEVVYPWSRCREEAYLVAKGQPHEGNALRVEYRALYTKDQQP